MNEVPVPQQLIDDVSDKPKQIIRVPKLNHEQRRKLRFGARRVFNRLATMPRERAVKILSKDDLEYWQRMHSEKLVVDYREVD